MRIGIVSSATLLTMMTWQSVGAQTADAPGLEEIIVTAQRREENLQRAAIAVSALSGEQIAAAGSTRVQDLTQLVPSLQVATAAGPYALFYLRGVGNFTGNSLSDSALAMNLDGVYISRPSSTAGMFYDVERLEVLKGPQGTLYGRNATGGAINVITRKPSNEFGGFGSLDAGNYGLVKFEGALNAPLSDTTALRIAGQTVDRDGYFSDGAGDAQDRAGRVQLSFEPSADLSIVASADYYQQQGKGTGATLIRNSTGKFVGDPSIGNTDPRISALYRQTLVFPAGDFLGPILEKTLIAQTPTRVRQDNEFWGVAATIDWRTAAGDLTIIPAHRRSTLDYVSTVPGFLIDQNEKDEQTSLEVRLASAPDRTISYLVGAYYIDESIEVAPATYDQQYNASTQQVQPETRSYAAFARLGYSITDTFRLTGGVRFTHDEKEIAGQYNPRTVVCLTLAPPSFCIGGANQITVPGAPIVLDHDASWSETTWRAGVEWDAAADSLLYATVETGFKAGGFFFTNDDPAYDPEKLTAYTVGAKNRFFDDRVQLNVEAFYWKYRDQQLSHLLVDSRNAVIFGTENVGKATMQGVELELQWLALENTHVSADVQYLDAVYDEFDYTLPRLSPAPPTTACSVRPQTQNLWGVNCDGKAPPQSPEWTVNLGVQQTFPFGNGAALVADLRTHYQSETLTGLEFLPSEIQESYWMSNASLTFRAPENHWSLSAYVSNIEDEDVVDGTFVHPLASDLVTATLRPPRTYGARLVVNF